MGPIVGAALLLLGAASAPERASPAREVVRTVQERLVSRGFAPGYPDGHWTDHTTEALRDFQHTERLPETGAPDPATLAALFASTATTAARGQEPDQEAREEAPAIERTRGVDASTERHVPVQSFGLGAAVGFLVATALAVVVIVRRGRARAPQ